MQIEWVRDLPAVILFIIGAGGLAGALLAMVRLWKEFIPDGDTALARDIASIKADVHDVRKRVGMLEIDLARLDQPAIARRFDPVLKHAEALLFPEVELLQLVLDQALGAFLEGLLNLADAHSAHARVQQGLFHQQFSEEVRLAGATSAPCALVAGWLEKRLEDRGGFNPQGCQGSPANPQ